jgi:hypothetical protein
MVTFNVTTVPYYTSRVGKKTLFWPFSITKTNEMCHGFREISYLFRENFLWKVAKILAKGINCLENYKSKFWKCYYTKKKLGGKLFKIMNNLKKN